MCAVAVHARKAACRSATHSQAWQLRQGALTLAAAFMVGCLALPARAQAVDVAVRNVVTFSTSASAEVVKDTLTITLQALREGNEATGVQTALKQAVESALVEARKQAAADALEVRTGGFNVSPRYGRDGKVSGWQGSAEVVLEGRDVARVAGAAGRLTGLTVTGSNFSVSRALRDRLEGELSAQAVQKFRARAADLARQFGFAGYALREVQVQGVESEGMPAPVFMARAMVAKEASAGAAVPTEAGKSVLTATVSGSVTLTP